MYRTIVSIPTTLRILPALLLAAACAETTAPLPAPEELLLVVNTRDATLSLVPISVAGAQVRIALGGTVPEAARPAAGRRLAVVSAGGGDSLAVVDMRQRRLERMIPLPPKAAAEGAVILGDTVAWVALSGRDEAARVHLLTGEVVAVPVGRHPRDIVLARGRLFVVNANVAPCPPPDLVCPDGEPWLTVLDPVSQSRAGGRDSIPLPGPGNASYAVLGADGRIYVLSRGGADRRAGRLSIVDPVLRTEVGSFGGFGELPGPIAADKCERIVVSSASEGLMEFNTRLRAVVRGAGIGIPLQANAGVATDSRNLIYGVESGNCAGGPGRVRVFRPDFTEVRTIEVGRCAGAAATAFIPPEEEPASR